MALMVSSDFRKLNSLFLKKLLGAGGVEIAEMCGVHDMHMRAKGALGAKEIEVAVGRCWRCRQVSDEIPAEAARRVPTFSGSKIQMIR